MKLMFLTHSMNMGGAERMMCSLSSWLFERGHNVTIVSLSGDDPFYKINPGVGYIKLNTAVKSKNKLDAIKNNGRTVHALRKAIKSVKPDAIFSGRGNTFVMTLFATLFTGAKTVGSEQSDPRITMKKLGKAWKIAIKMLSPFADGYIFQTRRACEYYPESVQKKSVVIPNAVFVGDVGSRKHTDSHEVCAVGRMVPDKGFDTLLCAFEIFLRTHPAYRLTLYGDGPLTEELQKLAGTLGISEKVNFAGKVTNVPERLVEAEMFVLSSNHEGMPNTLIEAMACGLPCVATDCRLGPAELIRDGESGLLVPVGDKNPMAEAMGKIADDVNFACRLGENASKIRETNSMDVIGQQFCDYFERVCGKH